VDRDQVERGGAPVHPPDMLERVGVLVNQETVSGHLYSEAIRPSIDTEEFELIG
jgi:hypothetical protein